MKYFASEKGFPLHRMNVTSYGEYKPIADNSTREGRAQNRRVALVLLK
jgi:outer membrane protein OmpA-like peptidoglycan-associated protein